MRKYKENTREMKLIGEYTHSLIQLERQPSLEDPEFLNTLMKNIAIFNPEKIRIASMLKNYHIA